MRIFSLQCAHVKDEMEFPNFVSVDVSASQRTIVSQSCQGGHSAVKERLHFKCLSGVKRIRAGWLLTPCRVCAFGTAAVGDV